MIRFIETNSIYENGEKTFSFFDTVNDRYCEFSGSQNWCTIGEFMFDFKGDNIERFLNLIPENFGDKSHDFKKVINKFSEDFRSKPYFNDAFCRHIINCLVKGVDVINVIEIVLIEIAKTKEINGVLLALNSTPITWRQTHEKIEKINEKYEKPE